MYKTLNNQEIKAHQLIIHDVLLIGIMGMLAACGLIYEYLLSHFAGRVLGSVETTIYAMIGLMIVAMGMGAIAARWFKSSFTAFAWLEAIVAFTGMLSILLVSAVIALSHWLPQVIEQSYELPFIIEMEGGVFAVFKELAYYTPFVVGFFLGFLIGMEIPLIARVRQSLHSEYLENNIGTIYGADYIGAGLGAVAWIVMMLNMNIIDAAILTATFNIIAGLIFIYVYRERIHWLKSLVAFHAILIILAVTLSQLGIRWMHELSNVLFRDNVVHTQQTEFQYLTFTERKSPGQKESDVDFFINGKLQFSTADEHVYHSMLVYPAMLSVSQLRHVLIVGGGDGLALRNVLRWNPETVTVMDLDPELINLFSEPSVVHEEMFDDEIVQDLKARLVKQNEKAFSDARVELQVSDAFIGIEQLQNSSKKFDAVIIDLPDPSHPDLNKMYTVHFYRNIYKTIAADGVLVVQSTSPFHAREAFISIGKTIKAAGFSDVEQYRQNVPSFGEWGWSIAVKQGKSAYQRISTFDKLPINDEWVNLPLIKAAFQFPQSFYDDVDSIEINRLGFGTVYQYHHEGWLNGDGRIFKNVWE
ncbi:MAG: polyamine aminopropyltransferase [Pseudomonadota bacterium]